MRSGQMSDAAAERIAELREEIARLETENPLCPTCYDTGFTPGPPCRDCKKGRDVWRKHHPGSVPEHWND